MSERGPDVWDVPDRTDTSNYEWTPGGTSSSDPEEETKDVHAADEGPAADD